MSWAVVADWLEPWEVEGLATRGVPLAVEWCGWWEWPARLRPEVRELLVSVERSNSLARGKYPDAVMLMPTLWTRYEGGPLLVTLSESAPLRRKVLAAYSRMPAGMLVGGADSA